MMDINKFREYFDAHSFPTLPQDDCLEIPNNWAIDCKYTTNEDETLSILYHYNAVLDALCMLFQTQTYDSCTNNMKVRYNRFKVLWHYLRAFISGMEDMIAEILGMRITIEDLQYQLDASKDEIANKEDQLFELEQEYNKEIERLENMLYNERHPNG